MVNRNTEKEKELIELENKLKEVMIFFASSDVPDVIMAMIKDVPDVIRKKIKKLRGDV